MNEDKLFDDVELETPSNTDTSVKDVVQGGPRPTDIEWNNYVMQHFEEDEVFDGMPLTNGLRRVAELLMGRIIYSGVENVIVSTDGQSIGRSTVVWKIIFEDGSCFIDVADSWEGNTDDMFCAYTTATAATRAEGRALRKALRLKTVAAEEVTKKNTAEIVKNISKSTSSSTGGVEYETTGRMTENQERFIDSKCKQLDINAANLFKEVFNLSVSKKIDKKQASDAIQKLNEYQTNKNSIPNTISGYISDWRK